jgi:hypothetical protein
MVGHIYLQLRMPNDTLDENNLVWDPRNLVRTMNIPPLAEGIADANSAIEAATSQ